MREAKDIIMQPTIMETWISKLSIQERELREKYQIVHAAVVDFRQLLSGQIESDLRAYRVEFPEETQNIHNFNEADVSIIARLRDRDSEYAETPCRVQFKIVIERMALMCGFPHNPRMDKTFNIVLNTDGTLGLADASVADLSQYLLAPVLFDKLIAKVPEGDSLRPSEGF